MTVLCSICSKHNLISEGPRLSTLKFITEIKDTNNSSSKKYVAKISYVHELNTGDCIVEQIAKRKVWFFFFFVWKKFHSIVLSILMNLN